jgi:hypothetical protein
MEQWIVKRNHLMRGQGSSIGIATELQAGRSGIESRWGWDIPPVQPGPEIHPDPCKMGTDSFQGVKRGRGVLLTIHHILVPRSWKNRAINLPNLWATTGLKQDHFTFYKYYASVIKLERWTDSSCLVTVTFVKLIKTLKKSVWPHVVLNMTSVLCLCLSSTSTGEMLSVVSALHLSQNKQQKIPKRPVTLHHI